ncbi:hypothetical protein DMN91_002809 [Ooceraea biroi]|uniref:Uncharacterized protein n=1 Tax=Ooceraea biroi TaxID=2015173 RepID=A0A3L8DXP9_OOCBI|nr:hypothetical protein DMN91_002809 [Ooceraea biroi]
MQVVGVCDRLYVRSELCLIETMSNWDLANINRGQSSSPTESLAEFVTFGQEAPYREPATTNETAEFSNSNERYSPLFVNIPSPSSSTTANPPSTPSYSPLSLPDLSPRWYSPIPSPEFVHTLNSAVPSPNPELSTSSYLPPPISVPENPDFSGLPIPTISMLREFSQGAFHLLLEYFLDFFPTYSLPLPLNTITCGPGPINIPALRIAVRNAGSNIFVPFITHHRIHPVLIPASYIREFIYNFNFEI